ncbi:hypothetical protein ABPG75_010537 [Micractinium tetrahymenae]
MALPAAEAPKLCSHAMLPHVEPEQSALTLPDDVLASILSLLPQKQRRDCFAVHGGEPEYQFMSARAALVCRRWAAASRSTGSLWESVELSLALPDPHILDRTEGFVAWLIPRARAVNKLTLTATRDEEAVAAMGLAGGTPLGPLLVWSNLVSALTLLGPTLNHLAMEWPDELQLGAWVATLVALESASFTAPRVIVRPGLGSLPSLTDLRFRSAAKPLTFHAAGAGSPGRHAGGAPLLPAHLVKLKLEGCRLSELPASLSRLSCLEDLVLSDNNLQSARLSLLSRLTTLQSLTLMGCHMHCLPPALSALRNLRVLYLDMAIQAPTPDMAPVHRQCDALLGPLEHLGILSMGACHLQAFPAELASHTALRALYLDDNIMTSLPAGCYLDDLRVLGVDWRVLFNSHAVLRHAPQLAKLCLTSQSKLELAACTDVDVPAVVASITSHPALKQVLIPSQDGTRGQIVNAALNVLIGISRTPHLEVKAITYPAIGNEWLDWLREVEAEEGRDGLQVAAPPALMARRGAAGTLVRRTG